MSSTTMKAVCWIVMLAFSVGWVYADDEPAVAPAEKVALMSDEEARQALVEKLESEAMARTADTVKDSGSGINGLFFDTEEQLSGIFSHMGHLMGQSLVDGKHWQTALDRMKDGKGTRYLAGTFLLLLFSIGVGVLLEGYVRRRAGHIDVRGDDTAAGTGWLWFCKRVLSNTLLEVLYAAVFIFSSLVLFAALFKSGQVRFTVASGYMLVCYYIRGIILAGRVFFAPGASPLRLIPMSDDNARFVYRWIIAISVVSGLLTGTAMMFRELRVDTSLYLLVYSTTGMVIALMLAVMIWRGRKQVARAMVSETAGDDPTASMNSKFASIWHIFAIALVIGAGLYWQSHVLAGGQANVLNLIISMFVIPVIIVLDHWMRILIGIALDSGQAGPRHQQSQPAPEGSEEPDPGKDAASAIAAHLPVIKFTVRMVLLAFGITVILRLWNIDIPLGRLLTSRVLSILIITILGLAVWQFIKIKIDQRLQAEIPDEDEEKEEGGAGGSRRGTLLVLFRKFVFAALVIVVGLTVLSSLGVNIAPLVAGAGVLGLAIGFGAQTLVKDILSGVFFLIDDAFRVGDYIETGATKGMIEHISLRSLRLRHPRGMVHTIPFSDINTVTNFSRDYIITKLDFRVRYDADIDKIRKIIKKKVNKVIMANEELAPKLLAPIKSQGVRQMDDSAMVMRVKYKTIPGEQFIIRKEVYRLMQEAFREAGIEFAHRNVTVYMPNDAEENGGELSADTREKVLQAGAASITADEATSPSSG